MSATAAAALRRAHLAAPGRHPRRGRSSRRACAAAWSRSRSPASCWPRLYHFWLRDSSLVAVDKVQVTGLTSSDAASVRARASRREARTMTTLHVDQRRARQRGRAASPSSRGLEVSPDFPHGLRVHVIEYQPAAIAVSDSGRVPVAGDGTILRGIKAKGNLPTIAVDGAVGGDSLTDRDRSRRRRRGRLRARACCARRIEDVQKRSDDGYVAELRDGPELLFGSARQLRAKWAAAARVLADLEARGATYVDLRIPGRPAVGGLAASTVTPVAPAGGSGLDTTGTSPTRRRPYRRRRRRRPRRPRRRPPPRRPPRRRPRSRPSRRPRRSPQSRSRRAPEAARRPLRRHSTRGRGLAVLSTLSRELRCMICCEIG